jgi:glucose/arabinose dehydrogenase
MKDCRPLPSSIVLGALSALGLVLGAVPVRAATLAADAATAFDIAPYVEGLGDATDAAALPDGRLVVIERSGNVYTQPVGAGEPLEAHVDVNSSHGEQGLLGVVADPDFATNKYLYFYASAGADAANRHQVQRYKLGDDGMLTDKKIVVEMGLRGPANHNGGALDVYQGNLYIGVGDTGANSTPPTNKFSSCLNQANGKVLRVSLAEATLGQPPADNPLVDVAMVTGCDSTSGDFGMRAPEKRIFAWGFRNPFRLWVDRTNGKVWVGDVGETTREEITITGSGNHNGYPFWEGTTEYNQAFKPANGGCMGMTPATACVAPAFDWARASAGTSIGGRILDGCGWPAAWKSRYIFGDHEQGTVWTLDVTAGRDGVVDDSLKEFAETDNIRALRMGTDNALYMVEKDVVSRVTAKGSTTTPNSCPSVNGSDEPVGGGGSGGGGAGGAGPNGGNGNTAGTANSAGTANGAGNGTGGAGNSSGSGNTSGSGNPGGGTANGAGSGSGGGPGDDGGCGCTVVGGSATSLLGLGALGAALGLALGRRRRRD